jgi:hypothetical protein
LGGVVWHTQGSGKSLTMVMLAKEIARLHLSNYKIVLVTDRVDLDDQIYRTFTHCDMEPNRAKSGRDLAKLLQGSRPINHFCRFVRGFRTADGAFTRMRLSHPTQNRADRLPWYPTRRSSLYFVIRCTELDRKSLA